FEGGQVPVGAPAGGQAGGPDVEQVPQLDEVADAARRRGDQQVDAPGQAVGERGRVGSGDVAAAGDAPGGHDQVFGGEQAQRFADGAAAEAGAQAQLRLGGQPVTRPQP